MKTNFKKIIKHMYDESILKPISKIHGKCFLKNTNFTIISNNCWGGTVYRDYGLEYYSPTVGMYFFAEEYIKFLRNIRSYMTMEPHFIDFTKSKYYNYMLENNHETNILIALIGDVEIVFLHYKSKEEAFNKWERRKKRINWDNMIVKFNDQNLCTEELINEFDKMNFKNKICFTAKPYNNLNTVIVFDEFLNEHYVLSDTKKKIYRKYINTTKYINFMNR